MTPMLRFTLLLASALLLTACAGRTPPPLPSIAEQEQLWQQHQQQLATLGQWRIKGKLGIRAPNQKGSAFLNWQQQQETYQIHLNGPFGQGAISLQGTPAHIEIRGAEQGPIHSNRPQALFEQAFGWSIPLTTLPYWAKGLPAPGLPYQHQLNTDGTLQQLQQAGWQLHISQYQQVGTQQLPRKLTLTQHDTRLKLIITHWQLESPLP